MGVAECKIGEISNFCNSRTQIKKFVRNQPMTLVAKTSFISDLPVKYEF